MDSKANGGRTSAFFQGAMALGLALVLTACATVMHGTRQSVKVSSEPVGATVSLKGTVLGVTPTVVRVPRKEPNPVLRFELEGYDPVEVALKRGTSGWLFGNLAIGGVLGIAIDLSNGAAYSLSPADVKATLQQLKQQESNADPGTDGDLVLLKVVAGPKQ